MDLVVIVILVSFCLFIVIAILLAGRLAKPYPYKEHFSEDIGFYEAMLTVNRKCPECGHNQMLMLCWDGKIIGFQCFKCFKVADAETEE